MESHGTEDNSRHAALDTSIPAGHDSDGIIVGKKRPPAWLLWLFIFSVIWAIVYVALFGIRKSAPDQANEYRSEVAAALAALPPRIALPVDSTVLIPFTDRNHLKAGRIVWDRFCSTCHLAGCQGFLGPNLTDQYTFHGCTYHDIIRVISHGEQEKGMVAWKQFLTTEQILDVASFILLKKDSHPPGAKAPQGEPCHLP